MTYQYAALLKRRNTFEIIDDPVGQHLGGVNSGVEVSELCLRLQEGAKDFHLKQEGAELPDRLPSVAHRHLLLLALVLGPQLGAADTINKTRNVQSVAQNKTIKLNCRFSLIIVNRTLL